MTAASLTYLPVQVGGALLGQAGRVAVWVVSRYMRAPLAHTAIAALVGMSALAGSNALFLQRHAHPSPLFSPPSAEANAPEVEPVVPLMRPKNLGTTPARKLEAKPVLEKLDADGPIGNADVIAVQRKLEALKLFSGTIDGYFGPQTARAIKKFEQLSGLKQKGQLTHDIVEAIAAAPLTFADTPEPQVIAAPVIEAPAPGPAAEMPAALPKLEAPQAEEPEAAPQARIEPLAVLAPLPEPTPLGNEDIQTGSIGTPAVAATPAEKPKLLGRPLPETPQQAVQMAADTAGDAIDTIISGVQTVTMNKLGAKPPADVQPYAAPAQGGGLTASIAEPTAAVQPTLGVPLKIEDAEPAAPGEDVAVLDTDATPDQIMPVSVTDPVVVARVQRGLASLGFLHGPADGVAGEATAKAIRNFEVYFNYNVTGRISPELLDLLVDAGASI